MRTAPRLGQQICRIYRILKGDIMKILIVGASGMLGNAVFRVLSEDSSLEVFGTVRSESSKRFFKKRLVNQLFSGINVDQNDCLEQVFNLTSPDIVINCIGVIKQLSNGNDPLQVIPINSLLPHRISLLCGLNGAKLIHVSTDCIFNGTKGGYVESDNSDSKDLYGMSKYLGEVSNDHSVTLRTSIIGHELNSKLSLVDWFLSQDTLCSGYRKAVFSGLPTVVLAQIIRDVVIPHKGLTGVYHVAARSINKYDLLNLIAKVYNKSIQITADESLVIDRSLNADKFFAATGYTAPEWPELINIMYADQNT